MKFEIIKNKLAGVLYKAERVSGKNPNLKILECLLLNLKNNTLTINSTNLDIGLKISLPVKGVEDGSVAIPASVFTNLVTQTPENTNISLEAKNGVVYFKTKTINTIINTQDYKEFPIIPSVSDGVKIKVPAQSFLSGLRAVWYSSAVSNMKPELSSVYITSGGDNMVFAATDSFRLAEKRVLVKGLNDFKYFLLPFRNAAEIIKLLEDINDILEISISKNQISISIGSDLISSRVVEGNFPDYEQILPKEYKTDVVVLKQDLINALKLANLFSNNFNQINLDIDKGKNKFQLNTENQSVGKNTVSLDAVIKGESVSINFNHKYISECFQSVTADSVSLGFNGLHKPVLIKGVGDKSFTYLVMPMNK